VFLVDALHQRNLLIAAGQEPAMLHFFHADDRGSYCKIIGIEYRSVTLSTEIPTVADCPAPGSAFAGQNAAVHLARPLRPAQPRLHHSPPVRNS